MKHVFLALLFTVSVVITSASCGKGNDSVSNKSNTENNNNQDTMSSKLKIRIGSQTFTATLLNNNSTKAFVAMLPLTISMADLNGNEKHADFSSHLPTNSSNPGTIQNGDIMLYGSRTLVLFYKSFQTSYSYTKLGSVNDASGFAAALRGGSISATFELE